MNGRGRLALMPPAIGGRSNAKMGRMWNTNIAFSSDRHRKCSVSSRLPSIQCASRRHNPPRTMSRIRTINVGNHQLQTVRLLSTSSRRCFASETSTSYSSHDIKKTTQPIMSTKDFKYSVDLVQNRDRESYLCGLLMPSNARKSYFAIRAWNVELASIKDGSTLKKSGGGADSGGSNVAHQVRFQWWWDALDKIYENPQQEQNDNSINKNDYAPFSVSNTLAASYLKNPIVRVLKYAVHEKQLTRRFIERLSEAREVDSHSHQPETMTEMIEYADNIFSSLLYLTLETVDMRDESVDIVAQHAGIGIGLVTALRGIRMRLIRGECSIPKELLQPNFPYDKLIYTNKSSFAGDEDQEDSVEKAQEKENELNEEERQLLKDAVEQICTLGYSHLSRAQELQSDVPKHARACFLPVIPAMHYLNKLEKADYDIFDDTLLEHDNMTILALLGRTWLTGVF